MRYHFKPDSKNQYLIQKPKNLGDNLESFALDMWELVYRHPYASGKPRVIHGMAHVTRAAILGRVGYNLMRVAKVEGVDTLPAATYEEEAKLIEIALLLHDSGAESDGKDVHDNDNALNIYDYLTHRLSIPHETAKRVAEAARNKDWKPTEDYHELHLDEKGEAYFKVVNDQTFQVPPNVERLRLAIQFGDGVDYLRTHNPFDIGYLQLYQKYSDNELIRSATQQLLNEDRRLCDAFYEAMKNNGSECNGANAYSFVMEQMDALVTSGIDEKKAPCIRALYWDQVTADKLKQMLHRKRTGDAIIDAFHTFDPGRNEALLFRGVNQPNKFFKRAYDTKEYGGLTQFGYERYKIDRRPGGKSLSRKNQTQVKTGNPMRSMSFAAPGAMVFTGVGLGILMCDDRVTIDSAASKDVSTGYGKKERLQYRTAALQTNDISSDIVRIQTLIREGGGNQEHTELTGTIRQYDAIIYTIDKTYSSQDKGSPAIRFIQAVFVQHELHHANGRMLPLYELSCENAYIKKITVTPALIAEAFNEAIRYIIRNARDIAYLKKTNSVALFNESFGKDTVPLYLHFPEELKASALGSLHAFNAEKDEFIEASHPRLHASVIIKNRLNEFKNKALSKNINYPIGDIDVVMARAAFIDWIFDPKNAKLAHNKIEAFKQFLLEMKFKLNPEEQMKVDALIQSSKDESRIYEYAKNAPKPSVAYSAAKYTLTNKAPVTDLLNQAAALTEKIDTANTRNLTPVLLGLLSDIVFLSREEDHMASIQSILKRMKSNRSIPRDSAMRLLFFAIETENEAAIPLIAPVAIPSVSEAIQFIEHLRVKKIFRLDLIELVMHKVASHKFIIKYRNLLLYSACTEKNIRLVEAMFASKRRADYINAISLSHVATTILDEKCTALDNAIDAMLALIYKGDQSLYGEYNRWVNVVIQLLEVGAAAKKHSDVESLYAFEGLLSDDRWKVLMRSLLEGVDHPSCDQSQYLHLCVRSGYMQGIANLLRSGSFLAMINEIDTRYNYTDYIFVQTLPGFDDNGLSRRIFNRSDLSTTDYAMFSAMNSFLTLSPTFLVRKGDSYALTGNQKMWLSIYAESQPALAFALIDFQFQLISHSPNILNKFEAKILLLKSLIAYAENKKLEQFFAYEIREQAKKLLSEESLGREPALLIYLFKMGVINKACAEDMKRVDFDYICATEQGVFIFTEQPAWLRVDDPKLLRDILCKLPKNISWSAQRAFNIIHNAVGDDLFKNHDTLTFPRELVALYDACVRHNDFSELSALKKRALELAMNSGDPEQFFRAHGRDLFPLLNHQTRVVPHMREWFKSEEEMKNKPSTHTARLADTFVNPSATPQDKENAIRGINALLGREHAPSTSSNNKPCLPVHQSTNGPSS